MASLISYSQRSVNMIRPPVVRSDALKTCFHKIYLLLLLQIIYLALVLALRDQNGVWLLLPMPTALSDFVYTSIGGFFSLKHGQIVSI